MTLGSPRKRRCLLACGVIALLLVALSRTEPGLAGGADVVGAEARKAADGSWTFAVTVRHGDEGWEHYADQWSVLAPDGTVLGVRTLYHPHEQEQPFTRSLGGVVIADAIAEVIIKARDNRDDRSGAELRQKLPR